MGQIPEWFGNFFEALSHVIYYILKWVLEGFSFGDEGEMDGPIVTFWKEGANWVYAVTPVESPGMAAETTVSLVLSISMDYTDLLFSTLA